LFVMHDHAALEALDARLRVLLPAEYQDSYEALQPVPMRSAGLKYAADGTVAWDEIWQSFCDLAMAGGPPHKGALLDAGTRAAIDAHPAQYEQVVEEICRGIVLATDLQAGWSPVPGWIRVSCYSDTMADWLLRAITMENVSARRDGLALDLPASPAFRVDKEIKNVITVMAKTSHYWVGHMPGTQKQAIAALFAAMAKEAPLLEPERDDSPSVEYQQLAKTISGAIHRDTGLAATPHQYHGWLGFTCPSVRAAVWLMRAAVASNVLSRREETTIFVPVNSTSDADGERVIDTVRRVHRFAGVRGML
jgi:sirohydrochlorin cobaltochelatase